MLADAGKISYARVQSAITASGFEGESFHVREIYHYAGNGRLCGADRGRRTGQVHHATTFVVSYAQAEAGPGLAMVHEVLTQGRSPKGA